MFWLCYHTQGTREVLSVSMCHKEKSKNRECCEYRQLCKRYLNPSRRGRKECMELIGSSKSKTIEIIVLHQVAEVASRSPMEVEVEREVKASRRKA